MIIDRLALTTDTLYSKNKSELQSLLNDLQLFMTVQEYFEVNRPSTRIVLTPVNQSIFEYICIQNEQVQAAWKWFAQFLHNIVNIE